MKTHIALSWRNAKQSFAAALAVLAAGVCGYWGQMLMNWLA